MAKYEVKHFATRHPDLDTSKKAPYNMMLRHWSTAKADRKKGEIVIIQKEGETVKAFLKRANSAHNDWKNAMASHLRRKTGLPWKCVPFRPTMNINIDLVLEIIEKDLGIKNPGSLIYKPSGAWLRDNNLVKKYAEYGTNVIYHDELDYALETANQPSEPENEVWLAVEEDGPIEIGYVDEEGVLFLNENAPDDLDLRTSQEED